MDGWQEWQGRPPGGEVYRRPSSALNYFDPSLKISVGSGLRQSPNSTSLLPILKRTQGTVQLMQSRCVRRRSLLQGLLFITLALRFSNTIVFLREVTLQIAQETAAFEGVCGELIQTAPYFTIKWGMLGCTCELPYVGSQQRLPTAFPAKAT